MLYHISDYQWCRWMPAGKGRQEAIRIARLLAEGMAVKPEGLPISVALALGFTP